MRGRVQAEVIISKVSLQKGQQIKPRLFFSVFGISAQASVDSCVIVPATQIYQLCVLAQCCAKAAI